MLSLGFFAMEGLSILVTYSLIQAKNLKHPSIGGVLTLTV